MIPKRRKPRVATVRTRARQALTALGALVLAISLCSSCTAIDPANEPHMYSSLECGQPLRQTCGSRSRTFTQLPSQSGKFEEPPLQRAEDPQNVTSTQSGPQLVAPQARALQSMAPQSEERTRPPPAGDVVDLDAADDPSPYAHLPVAGNMTEGAVIAKRLFDKAKWAEAATALEASARGKYEDDDGNRQIAEYHLAIAVFNLKDYEAATDLFLLITEDSTHLKFSEAHLWIAKLATQCHTQRLIENLGTLTENDIRTFANPNQAALYRQLKFIIARGLVERGQLEAAAQHFAPFRNDVEYGFRARQCLEWIAAQREK